MKDTKRAPRPQPREPEMGIIGIRLWEALKKREADRDAAAASAEGKQKPERT